MSQHRGWDDTFFAHRIVVDDIRACCLKTQVDMSAVPIQKQHGALAAKFLIAKAQARNVASRVGYARQQGWYDVAEALEEEFSAPGQKAAVGPMTAADMTPLRRTGMDFDEVARPLEIPTRLPGVRTVPSHVRMIHGTQALRAAFTRAGSPLPVGQKGFASNTLEPRRVGLIAVITAELMRFAADAPASAANIIVFDLGRAIADEVNRVFVSTQAGTIDAPGGIFHDVPNAFVSSGSTVSSIDFDAKQMLDAFIASRASITNAAWVMREQTASYLGLQRGSGGQLSYPGLSAKGGVWLGLPVYVTSGINVGSPGESIIGLIDGSAVAVSNDRPSEIDIAEETAVQMTDAPLTGGQSLVSLFASDLVGLRAARFISWRLRNPAAAAVLTGVAF